MRLKHHRRLPADPGCVMIAPRRPSCASLTLFRVDAEEENKSARLHGDGMLLGLSLRAASLVACLTGQRRFCWTAFVFYRPFCPGTSVTGQSSSAPSAVIHPTVITWRGGGGGRRGAGVDRGVIVFPRRSSVDLGAPH